MDAYDRTLSDGDDAGFYDPRLFWIVTLGLGALGAALIVALRAVL